MDDENSLSTPPKLSKKEKAYELSKVAITSVVPFGGLIEVFIDEIIKPPTTKRLHEWIGRIAQEVERLKKEDKRFDFKTLSENEEFISFFHHTINTVRMTHQTEKIEFLQNGLFNSVLNESIQENIKHIFLNFIEECTVEHIRILKCLDNPREWFEVNNKPVPDIVISGAIATILERAFPDFRTDYMEFIVDDLHRKGLIGFDRGTLNVSMTPRGVFESRTTSMGKQFLNFIEDYK
ncbi:MAG: hypothetical protein ACFFDT_16250 [Candidatus Hodarchaeota archaeon]